MQQPHQQQRQDQKLDAGGTSEDAALLQEGPERLRRVTFSDRDDVVVTERAEASSNGDASHANGTSSRQTSRSCWQRFQAQVKALKWELLALYYAAHDPRTCWLSRLLPLLAVAYALSPLDLIPDFIPVIGLLDDLVILPALMWLAIRLIPEQVMEDARFKAEQEPMRLSKHWPMAVCIFSSWTALLLWCVHLLVQKYGDEDLVEYEWAVLAGAGGLATLGFTVFMIRQLRFESRGCDQWNAALLSAPLYQEPV